MRELRCLIAEDEELAARIIAGYINATEGLVLAGICEDAPEATQLLNREHIDVLFTDINMPGQSGLELARAAQGRCHIIFVTAHHEYGVEGFELDAVDYLLKPVTPERFARAITKVKTKTEAATHTADEQLLIKSDGVMQKIAMDAILYVEALQNYVMIQTTDQRYIVYSSLKNIEARLPASRFMQVQKSYIVAIDKVGAFTGSHVVVNGMDINIGRTFKDDVIKRLTARGR